MARYDMDKARACVLHKGKKQKMKVNVMFIPVPCAQKPIQVGPIISYPRANVGHENGLS